MRSVPLVSFSPKKAVCTMDCTFCRQMALRIRAEAGENSESPVGSAASSVASSRKASVVPSVSIGKNESESEGGMTLPCRLGTKEGATQWHPHWEGFNSGAIGTVVRYFDMSLNNCSLVINIRVRLLKRIRSHLASSKIVEDVELLNNVTISNVSCIKVRAGEESERFNYSIVNCRRILEAMRAIFLTNSGIIGRWHDTTANVFHR